MGVAPKSGGNSVTGGTLTTQPETKVLGPVADSITDRLHGLPTDMAKKMNADHLASQGGRYSLIQSNEASGKYLLLDSKTKARVLINQSLPRGMTISDLINEWNGRDNQVYDGNRALELGKQIIDKLFGINQEKEQPSPGGAPLGKIAGASSSTIPVPQGTIPATPAVKAGTVPQPVAAVKTGTIPTAPASGVKTVAAGTIPVPPGTIPAVPATASAASTKVAADAKAQAAAVTKAAQAKAQAEAKAKADAQAKAAAQAAQVKAAAEAKAKAAAQAKAQAEAKAKAQAAQVKAAAEAKAKAAAAKAPAKVAAKAPVKVAAAPAKKK